MIPTMCFDIATAISKCIASNVILSVLILFCGQPCTVHSQLFTVKGVCSWIHKELWITRPHDEVYTAAAKQWDLSVTTISDKTNKELRACGCHPCMYVFVCCQQTQPVGISFMMGQAQSNNTSTVTYTYMASVTFCKLTTSEVNSYTFFLTTRYFYYTM